MATVPLWIAVNLKLKKKCDIVPPTWLSVGAYIYYFRFAAVSHAASENLQAKLASESDPNSKLDFSWFPFCYAEIAKVLLDV